MEEHCSYSFSETGNSEGLRQLEVRLHLCAPGDRYRVLLFHIACQRELLVVWKDFVSGLKAGNLMNSLALGIVEMAKIARRMCRLLVAPN